MKINFKVPEKWRVAFPAKVLYYLGVVKLYHYGTSADGYGFVNGVYRKWHPLTWLLIVLLIIPCAIWGEKISEQVPFDMKDFYKQNLRWVTRKDFA